MDSTLPAKLGKAQIPVVLKDPKRALYIIVGIIVVAFILWALSMAVQKYTQLSNQSNIDRIRAAQENDLQKYWTGVTQRLQGIDYAFSTKPIPESQKLLINANVFGVRQVGCLGPFSSPVFDEANATRFALASGARCLILEIGKEQNGVDPKLIYRDSWGNKQSLNLGSIEAVAKQIAGRAFAAGNDSTPAGVTEDPLILVVYFAAAPSQADAPLEYVRFLGKVAEALQPLNHLILGQTPQGDFRRQAQETQLFYQPLDTLKRRIIVLTNADTTPFRRLQQLGLAGELGPSQDLDLMVHARLYSREVPSGLGITAAPAGTQQAAAVITTPGYWLNTPPERLADAVSQTKKAWTLVMSPVAGDGSEVPTKEQLAKLLGTYGVQCVPITLFQKEEIRKTFVGMGTVYEKSVWSPKADLIRYVPVPPITTQKPLPQSDSGGGAIRAPV